MINNFRCIIQVKETTKMNSDQLLQDYFIKYNLDYTKVKYKPKKLLSTDLSVYSIENKGDKTGVVITKNNACVTGSFEIFPLFQLLHVKVNILSWNISSGHAAKKELSEEEIVHFLFKILKNQ